MIEQAGLPATNTDMKTWPVNDGPLATVLTRLIARVDGGLLLSELESVVMPVVAHERKRRVIPQMEIGGLFVNRPENRRDYVAETLAGCIEPGCHGIGSQSKPQPVTV